MELARNHGDEYLVGQHYALWMEEKGFNNWREHFAKPTGTSEPQYGRWSIPEEFHYNTWISERTQALMEEYKKTGKPFFLWASFFDPHPPYLVPEPWDTMYDPERLTIPKPMPGEHDKNPPHYRLTQEPNPDFSEWQEVEYAIHGLRSHVCDEATIRRNTALYYGMVSCLDKAVGDILKRLDELGLAEDTIVIFTSDHGHFLGHHGLIAKGPFHCEDLLRIPFIVRWPGRVPAGVQSSALQSLVDMAPTLLNLAGVPVPHGMTGVDQSEVWTGANAKARDHVVVENRFSPTTVHIKTYIDERYKLTVYYNRPYGNLYDLQEDPDEFNNLWDDHEARDLKHERIRKLLFAEMGKEPMWMPRIAHA